MRAAALLAAVSMVAALDVWDSVLCHIPFLGYSDASLGAFMAICMGAITRLCAGR
jgi:hypothetical protein